MTGKKLKILSWLRWLGDIAPDMKLKDAIALAREHGTVFEEQMLDAQALAVLSETRLGFSTDGTPPDGVGTERHAVQWAMNRVQYRHAWVVCGPMDDPMETLLKEMDGQTIP